MSSKINNLKVVTKILDYPVSTLREMVSEGDLDTQPDYQRGEVYDDNKKSKLIESLLLEIPIPNVYLCEENDGTFSIIDGQQRITSFVKFLNNNYALKGLTELDDLNGKYYKDLDKELQKKIKNSPIHAVCLLKESQELKYEIFSRLNQGAVKLNEQELRNCIYRGSFNDMLKDIAKGNRLLPVMISATNERMNYEQLILRFFAMREYQTYKSSMIKTLNNYMHTHQNDSFAKIEEQKKLFTGTLDIVKQILGENAFKTYDWINKTYKDRVSNTAFDSIMVAFSFFEKNQLMRHADEIRKEIIRIRTEDDNYRAYTESSSSTRAAVVGRITYIYNAINSVMTEEDKNTKRIFDEEIKQKLWHDGYVCKYCGNKILSFDDAEVDHILPYSKGGQTAFENAQLLHRICNRQKSASINDCWGENDNE